MRIKGDLQVVMIAVLVLGICPPGSRAEHASAIQVGFCPAVSDAKIPPPWELKIHEKGKEVLAEMVMSEGDPALHMRSVDSSFSVEREFQFDPKEYPYLSWAWKAESLPPQGDVRESGRDDQALQVLVAFDSKKVIGYVWDSNAPEGTVTQLSIPWPVSLHIEVVVVRSGAAAKGQWSLVTRDLSEDYRRFFDGEAGRAKGIRVQMNTQHTKSRAEGYVKDILIGGSSNVSESVPTNDCNDRK